MRPPLRERGPHRPDETEDQRFRGGDGFSLRGERTLILGAVVLAEVIGAMALAGARPARMIFAVAPTC
ncbi:MAG TPA: hypothetical protein VE032_08525 [Actinomycetota bacterium]|nr:hypothetical protein [Actinomycetota bacterium]